MIFNFAKTVSLALLFSFSTALAIPQEKEVAKRSDKYLEVGFDVITANGTNPLSKRNAVPADIVRKVYTLYSLSAYLGSNRQLNYVLIDTGSSIFYVQGVDTVCQASTCDLIGNFNASLSTTWVDKHATMNAGYSGNIWNTGEYGTDSIALGSDDSAILSDFEFAYTTDSHNEFGISGMSYTDDVPTLPHALKNAGIINKNAFSLYLNSFDAQQGTIVFGGIDEAKFDGDLTYVSLPGNVISVEVDSWALGSVTSSSLSGVFVDSGTTFTVVPISFIQDIASTYGGSTSSDGDQYTVTLPSSFDTSTEFGITVGGVTINFPASEVVDPQDDGSYRLFVTGQDNGDLILGQDFLRHTYAFFNLDDNQFGLAKVKYTSDTNIVSV